MFISLSICLENADWKSQIMGELRSKSNCVVDVWNGKKSNLGRFLDVVFNVNMAHLTEMTSEAKAAKCVEERHRKPLENDNGETREP